MIRPMVHVPYEDKRDEEFRYITYPGVIRNRYKISNYGRVYSENSNKFLSPFSDKDGYLRLGLTTPNHPKRWKNYSIHRLVSHEFIDNPHGHEITNHIDGVKDNNYYLNLEHCSDADNRSHAVSNQMMSMGEDNYMNVFTEEFVHEVCGLLSEGKSPAEVCYAYGYRTTKENIPLYDLARNISGGNTWRQISKDYNIL